MDHLVGILLLGDIVRLVRSFELKNLLGKKVMA
jgi:hypothetical protein